MSRYIDADKLRADWLKNGENEYVYDTNAFLDSIDNAPTADVVGVVRCRECVHEGLTTCPLCFIEKRTLVFINHDQNFFCGKEEKT